jgi:hypothetical protein
MKKYIVTHKETQVGPLTSQEIAGKIQAEELFWVDYIFDEQQNEWVLLMEHSDFAYAFQKWRSEAEEVLEMNPIDTPKSPKRSHGEWYLLRGENQHGPFTYVEMIRKLQEKALFEYDFVWNSSLAGWQKVAEVSEFRPNRIRSLLAGGPEDTDEVKAAFLRRRYLRAPCNSSLIVHDAKGLWRGRSLEIGAGGAGITLDSGRFNVGDTLHLHFKPGDGVPAFNAVCTIVNANFTDMHSNGPYRYGVRFTSVANWAQKAIANYTDRVGRAA